MFDIFGIFKHFTETRESSIVFILGLIAGAMILDFATGVTAAYVNKCFASKDGINGILRKIISMIVMVFFIPVSVILPEQTGVILLYVMYVGYLALELASIFENLSKMGVQVSVFRPILNAIKRIGGENSEEH